MSRFIVGKITPMIALMGSLLILSGCVGGTTYGTGVTQERQLLNDLEGMVSFGTTKRKQRINYSARPNLVMPAQTATLPAPLEEEATTSNVDWPESPEQRLARIRGEAEEADPRSGEISIAEQRRQKAGIRILRGKIDNPDLDREGASTIDAAEKDKSRKVRQLRAQYAYSTGPTRKYLTEPPVEYRTPYGSAPAGDLGVSEAEKEKRAEKAAKLKKQNDTGMWIE
ncbi:MAG: hypothetical protein L3J32_06105 [Rhizobiaceae bacterium]|nr:hypothetical protein [Rhizobiaceae bacterium]